MIECINGTREEIPLFLIVTRTNILALWFVKDLDLNVAVTTSETSFFFFFFLFFSSFLYAVKGYDNYKQIIMGLAGHIAM